MRTGLSSAVEYSHPRVRKFNDAVCRAFRGSRRSQTDARVWLPKDMFPIQCIKSKSVFLKHSNDSEPTIIQCEDRKMYLRPVYKNNKLEDNIIGVDPEYHDGEWLSHYLICMFLIGEL